MKSTFDQISQLKQIANRIRYTLVRLSHQSKTPHLGSSLSCVDLLVAAYWGTLNIDPKSPDNPDRDRLILSKGHAAPALYTTLAFRSFFSETILETYAQNGSQLAEHPSPQCAPGVEAATGSLGHGLSLGLGIALANRISGRKSRVFVIMSDGECNEGSVWEAAMMAPSQNIDNLVAIIDFNRWQATGRSEEVMALSPLPDKWASFGWKVYDVDGHDLENLKNIMVNTPDQSGKPIAIIANTIKGRGVSFMEDDNNWHYRIPTEDEVEKARIELEIDA